MVDNKKQLKTYLILALCLVVVCAISVSLSFSSAGIGSVLIGLFIILASISFVFYLISDGNEKFQTAYSISLIATVTVPLITTIAFMVIRSIKK